MTITTHSADKERDPVLARARQFFLDNPDEMLTREDLQVKFSCGPDVAGQVARTLIREGVVTRDQLPRDPCSQGRAHVVPKVLPDFPACLTAAQRSAVEAVTLHGSIPAAARATGRNAHTIHSLLQVARRRAGAETTLQLVAMLARAGVKAEAEQTPA
jgi:hypothetical protein